MLLQSFCCLDLSIYPHLVPPFESNQYHIYYNSRKSVFNEHFFCYWVNLYSINILYKLIFNYLFTQSVSHHQKHVSVVFIMSSLLDCKIHRAGAAPQSPGTWHLTRLPQLSRSRSVSWHLLSACPVPGPGLGNLHALTSRHSQGSLSKWYCYSSHFAVQ